MSRLELPEHLRDIFFDSIWDAEKVWNLPTAPTTLNFADLDWHLDLTVWSTTPGEPLFNLSPRTVMNDPDDYPWHHERTLHADAAYPLEMFRNGSRWVVLDGYHRLAKLAQQRSPTVKREVASR